MFERSLITLGGMKPPSLPSSSTAPEIDTSRRTFLRRTMLATGGAMLFQVLPGRAEGAGRKIKLGVVGNGGRGAWIAGLFREHGGYEMHAVADYFAEVADACGENLGVDPARRFSTLSGYKRVLESGVEAVVLQTPPYFFPEHAAAAVEAGLHVYMAKPVAVDAPGALQIERAAREASRRRRTFFVDYQMPTDPGNQEVVRRLRAEGFGAISQVGTVGFCGGFSDPPRSRTIENRLRGLVWVNDVALGGDYIGNYDIHAIDAAIWALGKRPVAAMGSSRVARPEPHGDARDVCSVVYTYADGLVHHHLGMGLGNQVQGELSCRVYGQKGNALINYWEKASLKSYDDAFSAAVENLYEAGAKRNIGTFHDLVTREQYGNETAVRAVDGILTCVLGREAALRETRLTLEQVVREARRLEVDLQGLKT